MSSPESNWYPCCVPEMTDCAIDTKSLTKKKAFRYCTLVLVLFLAWPPSPLDGAAKPQTWIVSWAASQQIPEPHNALPSDDLRNATVRQIFHISAGGSALRVHVSNAFGSEALHFNSVHIAHPPTPASAAIDSATDRALTFSGSQDLTIPPGAEYISDPVEGPVRALADLAVTFIWKFLPLCRRAIRARAPLPILCTET